MNAQRAETAGPQNLNSQYDDISLRYYLHVIFSWWKEILLLTALTALLAGAAVIYLNRSASPTYAASADIVVARLISQVTLDERVSTQTEQLDTNASVTARRGALAQLAHSGAVAQAVIEELGEALPEEQRVPAHLMKMVSVEVPKAQDGRTPSDLIRITVTADDPELAASIANSWAKHYIEQVNAVFGELPPDVIESMQVDLTSAEATYQEAQKAYETFLAASRIDSLKRQINEKVTQRDALQAGKDTILNTIAEQDRAARIKLFTDLSNAQSQALYRVLNEQNQSRLKGLSQLYVDRDLALRYLDLARTLEEQIRLGGEAAAATNQQTLQFLKNQVFSLPESVKNIDGSVTLPPNITIFAASTETSSAEEQRADAEALIAALEQYVEQLNTRIETASQALLAGDDYQFLDQIGVQSLATSAAMTSTEIASSEATSASDLDAAILRSYLDLFDVGGLVQVSQLDSSAAEGSSLAQMIDQLDSEIQALRAELASETSREQILAQKRDLAWNTYDALTNKAAELSLERSAAGSEVRLGSPAIPPASSLKHTNVLIVVVFGGLLGFLAGLVLALISDYLGYLPPLNKQQSQPA